MHIQHLICHPAHTQSQASRAVTIGNFDGVHRGHAAIFDALTKHASAHQMVPTVVTFDPNPKTFFAAQRGQPVPTRISPLRNKLELFKQHGIADVVILPFNQQLANMDAHDFVNHILVKALNTQHLLIGDDFRFGAARKGDFALLQKLSSTYGYTLASQHAFTQASERISSTAVRQAIAAGDMALAKILLGHDYVLSGHIIYGQQLGRTIGVPTINLKMPDNLAAQGIFAVTVELSGQTHQGVASIGTRPSVKTNGQCWCEVHLFDFNENVYGQIAKVTLHHKIRDEEKFNGMDALMNAINHDIQLARAFFNN
ncbi:bifunctional riboflavin kinase/FAD synthetase [Hydromonas duriensis]|nr:bifunctional riboflavin kinase/FAD synthetase [Hydromonas duriensis]